MVDEKTLAHGETRREFVECTLAAATMIAASDIGLTRWLSSDDRKIRRTGLDGACSQNF
jgi:hypothetical protein